MTFSKHFSTNDEVKNVDDANGQDYEMLASDQFEQDKHKTQKLAQKLVAGVQPITIDEKG